MRCSLLSIAKFLGHYIRPKLDQARITMLRNRFGVMMTTTGCLILGILAADSHLRKAVAQAEGTFPCCSEYATEEPAGKNGGGCVFDGDCTSKSTVAQCEDDSENPCSNGSGRTGFINGVCGSTTDVAQCSLASTGGQVHYWSGSCNKFARQFSVDAYYCICSCGTVLGQLVPSHLGGIVTYQDCTSSSAECD